jgi:hypothetical protein
MFSPDLDEELQPRTEAPTVHAFKYYYNIMFIFCQEKFLKRRTKRVYIRFGSMPEV